MKIMPVVGLSDLGLHEELDIRSVLKKYRWEDLTGLVSVIGLNIGNAFYPKCTFFSSHWDYVDDVFSKIDKFRKKVGSNKVCLFTYRTSLEFLRYVYSIEYEEFSKEELGVDSYSKFELDTFKIVLKINEDLYERTIDKNVSSAFVWYYLNYTFNDLSTINLQHLFYAQCYYGKMLFDYLTKNNDANRLMYQSFLGKMGVNDWRDYVSTVLCVMYPFEKHVQNRDKGLPFYDTTVPSMNRINNSVLEKLSLPIDKPIPYSSENKNDRDSNVDYRKFRSMPLIKDKEGKLYVYNMQLLYEQLYNSIVFALMRLWNKKNGDYFQYYDKHFVEEYLFQRTILKIVCGDKRIHAYFPTSNYILYQENKQENKKDPDFYYRIGQRVFLFECKGMMINGSFKEDEKIMSLYEELKKKINGDEDNSVLIKQLANHISTIENAIKKGSLLWDKHLPRKAYYYPIFMLADMKIVQPGLMTIVNDWFYEELQSRGLLHINYKPVIIMSIDMLFIYEDLFRKNGIGYYIDLFLKGIDARIENGRWSIDVKADFNSFMLNNYGFRTKAKKYTEDYRRSVLL